MFVRRLHFAILAGALALVASPAWCGLFYVDQSVSSSGDGTSPDTAFKTIQEAISAAGNADEVIVASGTYTETVDFLGKAVTVRSTDETDPLVVASTVIELGQSREVVRFGTGETRDAVIAGFTIASGQVGVSCVWSSPTIRNNIIVANNADFDQGGGIYCYYASPLIQNNVLASNVAFGGGAGIACEGAAPLILENLIIGNNTDIEGAGILCIDSSPTIARNRIIRNTAQGNGGGISCWHCRPEILDNLIVSNTANSMGGGIACESSSSRIVGNTIANNVAQGGGAGGIHFFDSSGIVQNCIVWGNVDDIQGCNATFTCIEDDGPEDQGEGNIHAPPAFVDMDGADDFPGTEDDDYRLSTESPCRDAGSFSSTVTLSIQRSAQTLSLSWDPGVDLLGQNRVSDAAPDMGCCEYQGTLPLYLVASSLDLQQWSLLHTTTQTTFFFASSPTAREEFYRVSVSQ